MGDGGGGEKEEGLGGDNWEGGGGIGRVYSLPAVVSRQLEVVVVVVVVVLGVTRFMHGRSRMTVDPRTPTMPGRSASGFHRPGRHRVHPTRSTARCSGWGAGGGG